MRCHRSRKLTGSLLLIDRTPVTPLDPIAHGAAVARSDGQGRRPVFRITDTSADDARPENVGRRRSLALDHSEHDGRLMRSRDGGACAAVPAIMALLIAGTMIVTLPYATKAEPLILDQRAADESTTGKPSRRWISDVAAAATRFAIPESWIRAVIRIESHDDPQAMSPKGAMGLMQIMPATWEELRARHDLGDDPWRPRDNILAGSAYLREMHERYGTLEAALAAYNAGPAHYDIHIATGRPLPVETIDYVGKVMQAIVDQSPVARSDDRAAVANAPIFGGTDANEADGERLFSIRQGADGTLGQRTPFSDRTALEPIMSGSLHVRTRVNNPAGGGLFIPSTRASAR